MTVLGDDSGGSASSGGRAAVQALAVSADGAPSWLLPAVHSTNTSPQQPPHHSRQAGLPASSVSSRITHFPRVLATAIVRLLLFARRLRDRVWGRGWVPVCAQALNGRQSCAATAAAAGTDLGWRSASSRRGGTNNSWYLQRQPAGSTSQQPAPAGGPRARSNGDGTTGGWAARPTTSMPGCCPPHQQPALRPAASDARTRAAAAPGRKYH